MSWWIIMILSCFAYKTHICFPGLGAQDVKKPVEESVTHERIIPQFIVDYQDNFLEIFSYECAIGFHRKGY